MLVRLDKYLAQLGIVSRRDASKAVKSGVILVDGEEAKNAEMKINE